MGVCCSWDVRLAALKGYYGQPKSTIFPFAYLNPGGYISNVTFWLNALKDYELGKVSHNTSHRAHLGHSHDPLLYLTLRWLLLRRGHVVGSVKSEASSFMSHKCT